LPPPPKSFFAIPKEEEEEEEIPLSAKMWLAVCLIERAKLNKVHVVLQNEYM